jgi:Protein of unknown function (DUF3591)
LFSSIPNLIGQLPEEVLGVAVIENDLFVAPVFKHKAARTDFLLVKNQNSDDYVLRRIDHIYVVGQIEPKNGIFSPQSRQKTDYIKARIKDILNNEYLIGKSPTLESLHAKFVGQNEQTLRQEYNNFMTHHAPTDNTTSLEKEQTEYIKLEEHCIYEKMLGTQYELMQLGINKIFIPDKMKQIIQKYKEQEPNEE